jgi:hypothetical protein
MTMRNQQGKMTLMSLIMLAVLVLGGFWSFKYLGSGWEKKQIKKEVFDTLGTIRGGMRTEAELLNAIEDVLAKKDVELLELGGELGSTNFRYRFRYRMVTDYLLFKKSETIQVDDQIENFN